MNGKLYALYDAIVAATTTDDVIDGALEGKIIGEEKSNRSHPITVKFLKAEGQEDEICNILRITAISPKWEFCSNGAILSVLRSGLFSYDLVVEGDSIIVAIGKFPDGAERSMVIKTTGVIFNDDPSMDRKFYEQQRQYLLSQTNNTGMVTIIHEDEKYTQRPIE